MRHLSREAINKVVSKFLILYSLFVSISSTILTLLFELRIDVYISISILEYYILRALVLRGLAGEFTPVKILDIAYFIIFLLIVAYRVAQILFPSLLWW